MKKKKSGVDYSRWGYIFLAPFFITFAVFSLYPLATTVYYSFFEYYRSGLKVIGPNFAGLKNYAAMLTELPQFSETPSSCGSWALSPRSSLHCCLRHG